QGRDKHHCWERGQRSRHQKCQYSLWDTAIAIRKRTYVDHIVEQDHRAVKQVIRPMLGCKACDTAQATRTGIALLQILRTGQLARGSEAGCSAVEQLSFVE